MPAAAQAAQGSRALRAPQRMAPLRKPQAGLELASEELQAPCCAPERACEQLLGRVRTAQRCWRDNPNVTAANAHQGVSELEFRETELCCEVW